MRVRLVARASVALKCRTHSKVSCFASASKRVYVSAHASNHLEQGRGRHAQRLTAAAARAIELVRFMCAHAGEFLAAAPQQCA